MRILIFALFCQACAPWYDVDSNTMYALKDVDREQTAVRAEREPNRERVLIRASDIEERRPSDMPSYMRVRTKQPYLRGGIVVLALGVTFVSVGFGMLSVGGWTFDGPPAPLSYSAAGAAFAIGGIVPLTLGIIYTTIGARKNLQEVRPHQLAHEIGLWPVQRIAAAPPPTVDDL